MYSYSFALQNKNQKKEEGTNFFLTKTNLRRDYRPTKRHIYIHTHTHQNVLRTEIQLNMPCTFILLLSARYVLPATLIRSRFVNVRNL